jgi:ADP-dependent NAD(P)H-hydrate dehydratase / NAD(P)H-hydrate epimerase
VDRVTSERFRVAVDWLMEAAGWQTARHCRERTLVVCGRGNNGGDGLAAARHLHRWGHLAGVACLDRPALSGPASRQAEALEALGVPIADRLELDNCRTVLDAIFGTGLNRPAEGLAAEWIGAINSAGRRVVAVDVPSGLDADSGRAFEPAIRASRTVTLGLPKTGLLQADGPDLAGDVWVADIGVPREAYRELGIEVPVQLFARDDRVRLAGLQL